MVFFFRMRSLPVDESLGKFQIDKRSVARYAIFPNDRLVKKVLTEEGSTRTVRCLNYSVTRVATLHDNYWVNTDYAEPWLIILRNLQTVLTAATLGFYTPLHP